MDTYKTRALDLVLSRITKFHAMATAPDGTEDSHIYGESACDALLELHTDLAAEPDDEPIDPTEGQKFAALVAALGVVFAEIGLFAAYHILVWAWRML